MNHPDEFPTTPYSLLSACFFPLPGLNYLLQKNHHSYMIPKRGHIIKNKVKTSYGYFLSDGVWLHFINMFLIDSTKKDEENTMEKYYRQTELLHL